MSDTAAAHHLLHIDARLGTLHLVVKTDLTTPWTIIFGPSGSGKSSLLRAACGNVPRGTLRFAQRSAQQITWTDLETPETSTPPHLRQLAYAPQGSVLFPHLNVRENIAFATTVRRMPSFPLVDEALTLFKLSPLADRLPRELSGGERQRVSLARAFAVPNPTLMLLDEPFTGIDRSTRDELLPQMREYLASRNIPVLSVTHDVEEALLLDAEVIRLAAGRVVAQGPARDVLASERASMLQILRGR